MIAIFQELLIKGRYENASRIKKHCKVERFDFELIDDGEFYNKVVTGKFDDNDNFLMFNSKFNRVSGSDFFANESNINGIKFYLVFHKQIYQKYLELHNTKILTKTTVENFYEFAKTYNKCIN
ncbi:hypothetical protein [Neptunicella sp.]|uniref:hypothetical protein n=1 Tax=Neptunicella sp. TaxID=2125986 RepID=UPI003F6943D7